MNAPYRPGSYLTPQQRLKERLEKIRSFYVDGRGYFPPTMSNGSPSNAWLQTRGFKNIRHEGGGYTADLPEGWKAYPPLHVVYATHFDIEVRNEHRRPALNVKVEVGRNGMLSEATVASGDSWSADKSYSSMYYSSSYRYREPSLLHRVWPLVVLVALFMFYGVVAVNNRVTFERSEARIAEVLGVEEVVLEDHSSNAFFFGDPYEVRFNILMDDGSIISVQCEDGVFKSLFCSKRDS